jgi:AraC-like DNA-binding protein/mannose-6-phosphate isomerase-like protein (cupin superfamily)
MKLDYREKIVMNKEVLGLIVKREDGSEEVNYDDPSFPSYIYDGWIKPNVTWERVPHFHEDVEIVTVKSGKMAYCVNGKVIRLYAGDTIFVNANQIHYSMSVDGETATYVIFVVNPSILNSSVAVEMKAVLPIISNPNLPYMRFRNINEHTRDVYRIITSLPDLRRDPFRITIRLFEFWEIILLQSTTFGILNEDMQADMHTRAFKSMMSYIQQQYHNPVTLEDISASGNVSISLCNRIFHKYTGESPVKYLVDFRLRKVAEYLVTTTLSLPEIAQKSGFNGTSYMAEMFKRTFGVSPTAYRKTPPAQ